MNRFALTTLFTAAALAAALVPMGRAEAQCTGTETFCADVSVGASFGAQAQLIVNRPQRNAQVVVVTPAPPPPVQPPVVYVQPIQAPPPPPQQATVVVTTEVAQPQYQQVQYQQVQVATVRRQVRPTNVGFHLQVGGILSPDVAMGGGQLAFRLRPHSGHFALDIGGGSYWGTDYNGLDRQEYTGTIDGFFFFNPQHRFQLYSVIGVGASFAHAEGFTGAFSGGYESRDYTYLGGEAGLGAEFRFGRRFAMNVDLRGFVRSRVDGDPRPEFVEIDERGNPTGRTTDVSGGVIANLGATFYF